MAESQDNEKFTEEVIQLQNEFSEGKFSEEEFKKKLDALKAKYKKDEKPEKVKFKVKSEDKPAAEKKPEKKKADGIKEAKVIEVPEKYSRRSSYSINDIKKKIDRLDSEGVSSLRDRYKEKYGEELSVPDLHSENVKEALEDVKPYLDIDEFDESAADDEEKEEVAEEAEEEKKEKGEEGPSFFAKIIAAIKKFFANIFSRKEKKEASTNQVEEAVAVSNGE
jgi:hypothetical protein